MNRNQRWWQNLNRCCWKNPGRFQRQNRHWILWRRLSQFTGVGYPAARAGPRIYGGSMSRSYSATMVAFARVTSTAWSEELEKSPAHLRVSESPWRAGLGAGRGRWPAQRPDACLLEAAERIGSVLATSDAGLSLPHRPRRLCLCGISPRRNSSASSTRSLLPIKSGVRWCSSVGWMSRMRCQPSDAAPPACSARKASGATS